MKYDLAAGVVGALAAQPSTLLVSTADALGNIVIGETVFAPGQFRQTAGVTIDAGGEYLCGFVADRLVVIAKLA